jgi:hypothetical protein
MALQIVGAAASAILWSGKLSLTDSHYLQIAPSLACMQYHWKEALKCFPAIFVLREMEQWTLVS